MKHAPSPAITAPARRPWALLLGLALLAALALVLGPCQNAASRAPPAPKSVLVRPGAGP